jgi:lipoprotein LprG
MVLRRVLLGWLVTVAVVATGCSDDQPAQSSLPDAGSLLREAAAATKDISSAHFGLKVNGDVEGVPVHSADGDLTREGAAKGTVNMDLLGQVFEGEFVLVDETVYIKGPTGGYQKLPASLIANLYDPSAILNPDKGIANVLANVQNAKTEGKETVDGTPAYKVTGRAAKDVVEGLVPGVESDVDITFWIREDNKQPVKATAALKGAEDKPASVDVTLSDVDKPVNITAPA